MSILRSVSGVRGLAGEEISEDLAACYGRALGESLRSGAVAVGWDSRPGGDALRSAMMDGLLDAGLSVVDLGVVPTPTVGIYVRRHGLAGGVAVTASHNPVEYNGFKFFSADGVFLGQREASELFRLVDGESDRRASKRGTVRSDTAAASEHADLVEAGAGVDRQEVRAAGLKIVVDCVNAAGGVLLPGLLKRLGCELVEHNTQTGSGFPRGAEPTPENLAEFGRVVVSKGADAGLACDPDADRLAIVDADGRPIGEEYTLAIAVRRALSRKAGPVVVNVSTSGMIDAIAGDAGVPLYRTPVGELHVVAKMLDVAAVVGGEGNGGVILPEIHLGRDAATAAALVVGALADVGKGGVRALIADLPQYEMVKAKLTLARPLEANTLAELMRSTFPDGRLDRTDGAKIVWPRSWVHVRMSNTEPVVRIIAEAEDVGAAARLADRVGSALSGMTEVDPSCAG